MKTLVKPFEFTNKSLSFECTKKALLLGTKWRDNSDLSISEFQLRWHLECYYQQIHCKQFSCVISPILRPYRNKNSISWVIVWALIPAFHLVTMTSMFDQYNTALKREENPSNQLLNTAMASSGYVSVRTKQETPIFVKTQLNISLPKDIAFMRVANNWLFVLMANNTLLRLNLVDPTMQNGKVAIWHRNWGVVQANHLHFCCVLINLSWSLCIVEIYLERYPGLRVSNLFVDPTGNHLFIALTTTVSGIVPELIYLHRKSNKPKKVEKFRDHEITAVAFNHMNKSETSTGSILIGTSKGLIFETELGMEGEKMFQSCWKQVSSIALVHWH